MTKPKTVCRRFTLPRVGPPHVEEREKMHGEALGCWFEIWHLLERLSDTWPGDAFSGQQMKFGPMIGAHQQAPIRRQVQLSRPVES
jgi:hypothetical protein